MADGREHDHELPDWFYASRAVASTVVGLVVILMETVGDGPGRILIVLSALLLIGFAPTDLLAFFRGRVNGGAK